MHLLFVVATKFSTWFIDPSKFSEILTQMLNLEFLAWKIVENVI